MDDTLIASLAKAVAAELRAMPYTPEPQRFTREQAAKYLNVSERYLDELTADGIIPRAQTEGRMVRYDKAVLDHYLLTTRKQA